MRLADILTPERIRVGVVVPSKQEALRTVAKLLASDSEGIGTEQVLDVLSEREKLASTGVGSGVAIPHGRIADLGDLRAAVLVSAEGMPFEAIDGKPVHIVVGVLAPQHHTGDHLKVLARVSRLLRNEGVREALTASEDAGAALSLIQQQDAN